MALNTVLLGINIHWTTKQNYGAPGMCIWPFFINIAPVSNFGVDRTGGKAHSSMGLGESYHQPLRKTYRKIIAHHNNVEPEYALAASVNAMNDTLGPEGLVPSALVFGEFPKVHTRSEAPDQRASAANQAKIANAARFEMQNHMSSLRVSRALKHKTPVAGDMSYKV